MGDRFPITDSMHQEQISRTQLRLWFEQHGWDVSEPGQDRGEDFILSVNFGKEPTGIAFYVQLKSVTNLQKRRKGDWLPYRLKVQHLLRWSSFSLPVVLFVWDVRSKEGRLGPGTTHSERLGQ